MKKFTVITICLNIESEIRDTIESVLRQTYSDFEYLIKDGLSKDGTVSIAQSFASAFAERGISFRIISRSDSGIYDAMNQATRVASGEWVVYMNAGDIFASDHVLAQVAESGCLDQADVIYGDTIFRNGDRYYYKKPPALKEIRKGLPFCRQSTYTRRALLIDTPYSLKYRICSAFHSYLQFYREGRKFVYLPFPMSVFEMNGVSSNWKANLGDKIQILEDMPVRDEETIQGLKKTIKRMQWSEFMHKAFFRFIPEKLRRRRRRRLARKAGWKTAEEIFAQIKENI